MRAILGRNALVWLESGGARRAPHSRDRHCGGLSVQPAATEYDVVLDGDDVLQVPLVAVATGVEWRKLSLPGVDRHLGKGVQYGAALSELVERHQVTGNLVTDALLAAHAVEHRLPVVTLDSDFGRFPEVCTVDPLA